ncbi:MAG: histidine phosphatase family protein [Aureispira sp.]
MDSTLGEKKLLLLRHSKASSKKKYTDFKRPLTEKGRKDAQRLGEYIQSREINIDCICSSSAVRAKSTAKAIAELLDYPIARITLDSSLYKCKTRIIINTIKNLADSCKQVLVVGHNPAIIQTANHFQRDTIFTEVPKSGLIGIDFTNQHWSVLGHQEGRYRFFVEPSKWR